MSTSLVTVGVPCFNGENYLEVALDALRNQEHQNLEILVADNGSTDASVQIAAAAAEADERVKVLYSSENHGAAWNYNRLVEAANGVYFKWAAHDDRCEPGFIGTCADVLDEKAEVVLAHPQAVIIDADGDVLKSYDEAMNIEVDGAIKRAATMIWNVGMCHAVFGVIRTDVLRQTPLIQPFDSSDVALLAELALHGNIVQTEERLFQRRRHDGDSRRANATSAEVTAWFNPAGGPKGRSIPLIRSYLRSARSATPNLLSAAGATAMFATLGPLTEIRWHRRARRRLRRERETGITIR